MKIKSVLLVALVLLGGQSLYSQEYKFVYYFDKDLSPCKKSQSIITGKGLKENGLFRLDYFANTNNQLLMTVHFTDSSLSVMHGTFVSYHNNNLVQESGDYKTDLKEGLWQQWDKDGHKTDSLIFENNYRIRFTKFGYYHKDKSKSSYAFTDSLANTFTQSYYRENGTPISEVYFIGEKGLLKNYDSTGTITKSDSVFTREEKEATFPGGDAAWRAFLGRNLNVEVPANNRAPSGVYTVVVKFIVTKDGTLSDVFAETYVGYGVEVEAIRVIKKSPQWLPAKQYGRFVNAYRRQPISFSVSY